MTYKFDTSDSSNNDHNFALSTIYDGSHNGGNEYLTGVTKFGTSGQEGAYLLWKIPNNASAVMYYYDGNFEQRGGAINMKGIERIIAGNKSKKNEKKSYSLDLIRCQCFSLFLLLTFHSE